MIKTKYGQIEGISKEMCHIYLGIPYAKPPVGKLRWHAPEKPDSWEEILEAKEFPNRCPQEEGEDGSFYQKEFFNDPLYLPPSSEDCLYLNIWAPKEPSNCPVAIWFHGGALQAGYNSEKEIDGEGYAKRGIILVSVNYRLGIFGYFAHPELKKRDGESGNYGFLDQIAAIDWVIENIGDFGGDARNITIFGQSAGGISIRALCTSPLVNGKVKNAIIQSGGGYISTFPAGASAKRLEKAGEKFLKNHNMTLQNFYSLSSDELVKFGKELNQKSLVTARSLIPLGTVADGYALIESFNKAVRLGHIARINYLIGFNKNDLEGKKVNRHLHSIQNKIRCSSLRFAQRLQKMGIPCHAYYFKRQMPGDDSGAFHSAELWYMFGTWRRCWRPLTEADGVLSEKMMDAWAEFMRTGNVGWSESTVKVWDVEEEGD